MEHVHATCAANCCSWFKRGLPLFSFSFRVLNVRDSLIVTFTFFPSYSYERSLVARVDGEPSLLVYYRLTHPGWGIVDECRRETADRVARYQTN